MPRQVFVLQEREALKEFREALESGEAKRVMEQHNDEMLLELLRYRRSPWCPIFWGVAITVFLLLTLALQLWLQGQVFLLFSGVTWTHIDDRESRRKSPKAWHAIGERIETSSLQTLLAVHRLNIKELATPTRDGMVKQLNRATTDELEQLTDSERKELVRFTLRQLRPQWAGYPVLDSAQRQAATLGYLALATLRQPGAERPNRAGMNATHTHLSKAIDEYLSAVRKSG